MNSLKMGSFALLSFFLSLSTVHWSFAQQSKLIDVQAYYDSTAVPELFTTIPIGLVLNFSDGQKLSTRGLMRGRLSWSKIGISTEQGKLNKGSLHFNRQKVWKNDHQVTFNITYQGHQVTTNMPLPYLTSIQFNLYADSLITEEPFYLNVEGHYSNGKIYPLNTDMVYLKSSQGTLDQNSLLFSPGQDSRDSTVTGIMVQATLKHAPQLQDSIYVPIKTHFDPIHLPTERELMDQWKQRRRRR